VPWRRATGNAAEYLSREAGLNYVYLRANGNRRTITFEEGSAILSRYRLKQPRFVELQPRAGFFEHRIALGAVALTPWGELDVFVTHLTNGEAQVNYGQALTLQEFVDQTRRGFAIVKTHPRSRPCCKTGRTPTARRTRLTRGQPAAWTT
jgi:endonuclease/exonuclease/phosphatase family metal-dependent hydrolase